MLLLCILNSYGKIKSNAYDYLNDPSMPDKGGVPINDTSYYFPLKLFVYTIKSHAITRIGIDSFKVKWFSKVLSKMNEPLLYNYYLNKTVY